ELHGGVLPSPLAPGDVAGAPHRIACAERAECCEREAVRRNQEFSSAWGRRNGRWVQAVLMRSAFDQDQTDASWLIPRLGLEHYPIEVIAPQQIPRRNCLFCRCPDRAVP